MLTYLSNFLKNYFLLGAGKFPIFRNKNEEVSFLEELEYWQVPNINLTNDSLKVNQHFNPEWCASTLSLEYDNTLIKKNSN